MPMAKYLVTGAAGFIGRSIAAELLASGESVRGIDNFSTGKRENLAGLEAMEFIEADLNDANACAKACRGVDVVFHEAAIPSVPRSVVDPYRDERRQCFRHAAIAGRRSRCEGAPGRVRRIVLRLWRRAVFAQA